MGLIKYYGHSGYIASVLEEDELMSVRANAAGIFRRLKGPNDTIRMGEVMAEIIDPYEGDVRSWHLRTASSSLPTMNRWYWKTRWCLR